MFRFLLLCQLFVFSKQEFIPTGHLQPLGSHRPPEGAIKSVEHVPTSQEFYNEYVLKGQPVIFKGAAKLSPGFQLWSDSYLREKYGDVIVRVDYGKKENRARPADNIALREFLSIYNDSDRYLVDTLPEEMWPEFSLPSCLLCGGFTSRLQDAVLWYSSGGSKSFLHMDTVDNINCMISGVKQWFIVDLEHTKLIDMDHGEGDYCSVNVDKVDMFKYPSLQNLPWWSARLEQGDCMFIPYGWGHQVTSLFRNIAVNIWWTPLQRFNSTDCEVNLENLGSSQAKLSNFKFTTGEQLRFMALQVIKDNGGSVSFETINPLIVGEHTGERLITEKRFAMLDKDQDGVLTEDDVMSVPADVVDEAFGQTPPGEVNIRGQSRHSDPEVTSLLASIGVQPAIVEEFMLRDDKTLEDYERFLSYFSDPTNDHSDLLHDEVRKFIEERINELTINSGQKKDSQHDHREL
ncbi:unnamed protein product [Porites evermanni]|uniref:JmjC domain-containing protein n=2 Tax=Porites TaxID=46719 RepID=A0ABN8SKW0_9CNID|nr:unnamed protein product [Porites evermanni]